MGGPYRPGAPGVLPDNGAFPNSAAVPEALYRSLVWLDVRLGVLFAVALPLLLLVWAQLRQEGAVLRLLGLYWKVASLMVIALLLLTDRRPMGYALLVVAPLLIVAGLWFWVDLNEELADLPPWRPLPLTVRIWRWSLTLHSLLEGVANVDVVGITKGRGWAGTIKRWNFHRQPTSHGNSLNHRTGGGLGRQHSISSGVPKWKVYQAVPSTVVESLLVESPSPSSEML